MPHEVIDATFECAKGFFGLDIDVKNEVNYKKSEILRGYEPLDEV